MTDASSRHQPPNEADTESTYRPPESLSGTIATGLRWKLATQLVREGSRLVVAVFLARILTPEQWGLATMALVAAAFIEFIPDSMSVGLVQRQQISERDRSTIFWTIMAMGVGISVLGIAASGFVAELYGEPQVQELFMAVSVGFAISASTSVPETILMRDFAYRAMEVRQMIAALAGGAAALALALAGAGPWAIVANSLVALTTSAVLLWWFARWRPKLTFSRSALASLGADGVRVLGTQLLTLVQLSADKLLTGRYLGAGALGSYSFAYQLMFTPVGNIAYPVQHVLFPVLAMLQEDTERLNAAWLRTKRLSIALMAPVFLILLVVGPDLIPTVFGTRWEDSVAVLQLLCLAGVAYSLGTQNWSLLVVRERSGTLFLLTFLTAATVVTSVVIGLDWGIRGVAAMLAVGHWVLVLPELWITTYAGSVKFLTAARATLSPLPFAAAAAVGAYFARLALVELDVLPALRIVLVGAVFVSLYASLAYVGSSSLRREMRAVLRSRPFARLRTSR